MADPARALADGKSDLLIRPCSKVEAKIKIVIGGLAVAGFAAYILFQGALWANAYMPLLAARGIAIFSVGARVTGVMSLLTGGLLLFGLFDRWQTRRER